MPARITPGQIKKTNRQQIYDYIYQERKVSQQDISYNLRLSRPTVATNLGGLEADGLIFRNGQQDTDQIGRKAVAYSIVPTYRIAIGVELMQPRAKIIAVDLYGQKLERVVHEIPYENQDSYYQKVSHYILDFIDTLRVDPSCILGIGFAMQGLVSPDGATVVYGKILDCSGVHIDVFSRYLPFPCSFIHDPDGAALSELWRSPELTDAIYLSLSRHLGGSFISGGSISTGKHGHSATFEHIQANPRGEICYCGKRGCLETVLSMNALLGDRDADSFFEDVRANVSEAVRQWRAYLRNLAVLVENLHLVHDVDIILGGHLAPYFTEEDIRFLYDEVRKHCPFQDLDDYILISKMPSHNINIGAALPYIKRFLHDIGSAAG